MTIEGFDGEKGESFGTPEGLGHGFGPSGGASEAFDGRAGLSGGGVEGFGRKKSFSFGTVEAFGRPNGESREAPEHRFWPKKTAAGDTGGRRAERGDQAQGSVTITAGAGVLSPPLPLREETTIRTVCPEDKPVRVISLSETRRSVMTAPLIEPSTSTR